MVQITKKTENLREQVRAEAQWFKTTGKEAQKRWMRLAHLLQSVRDSAAWQEWKGRNGKFTTFDEYVESEVSISKSKAYAMLTVVDSLKLPAPKLEELGKTKCYELARVAKESPKTFERVLKRVEKDPEMTVSQVKTMVDSALAGRPLDSGRYTRFDFLVKDEDAKTVVEAIAVMQALEPLENPDSPFARGVHLVSIAQEYLSGEEETKTLKALKKAGYFDKVPFQLEG